MIMASTEDLLGAAQTMSIGKPASPDGLIFGMSMWAMMASLVFSGAGLFYFKIGKSNDDMPVMISGIALIIYPYFVTNTLYMVLMGLALLSLPWVLKQL